jgi:thiamine-phosphate pyrophosphorylase
MILRGYYAMLDIVAEDFRGDTAHVVARAQRLLAAEPCMLQIRAKAAPAATLAELGRAVLPLSRAAGVPLCINDRLDVALAIGADAVHLGQDDLPLSAARAITRGQMRIGISTHNTDQAWAAALGGADYIGFGPIFATASKANPDPVVGIAGLRQVATRLVDADGRASTGSPGASAARSDAANHRASYRAPIPIVAIGGITAAHIDELATAGAAAAALISSIDGAADPVALGRAVNAAFGRHA